jgi:hypothetical protein
VYVPVHSSRLVEPPFWPLGEPIFPFEGRFDDPALAVASVAGVALADGPGYVPCHLRWAATAAAVESSGRVDVRLPFERPGFRKTCYFPMVRTIRVTASRSMWSREGSTR